MTDPKDKYEIDIDDSEWFAMLREDAPEGPALPRRELTEAEINGVLEQLFPEGEDEPSDSATE